MRIIPIALFVCCLGVILDVGEAKAESSTDGGFDASEREQFLLIIKKLEEQVAKEQTTNEDFRTTNQELRTTNELREEIHRQRENKDSKTIKKLQSQLKSRGAATKRLRDAANFKSADIKSADIKSADIKSANGSLHTNSSRRAADLLSTQLTAPFIKPVKTTVPILQLFLIKKTWNSARSFCKALGGDLASFPNTKELKRAQKIVNAVPNIPGGYVWLGARCDGAMGESLSGCLRSEKKKPWKWVTGEVLPYSDPNWYGYPNGDPEGLSGSGCLVSYFASYDCDDIFSFLCQF